MRPTPRSVFLLVTALAAALIVLAARMEMRPPLPANSVGEGNSPQLGDPRAHPTTMYGVPALEWDLRYHAGMSRDDIRRNLPRNIRYFVSVPRPPGGWEARRKDEHGVAWLVRDFEAKRPGTTVWACDFFQTDGVDHFLFYDGTDVLIGYERVGGGAVLSAGTGRANFAAPGDAPTRICLRWLRLGRRATEQRR